MTKLSAGCDMLRDPFGPSALVMVGCCACVEVPRTPMTSQTTDELSLWQTPLLV